MYDDGHTFFCHTKSNVFERKSLKYVCVSYLHIKIVLEIIAFLYFQDYVNMEGMTRVKNFFMIHESSGKFAKYSIIVYI